MTHTHIRTFFAPGGVGVVGGSPDRRPSAAPAIAGDLRPGAPSCRVPPGVVAFRHGTCPQEDTMSSITPTVAQIETAAQAAADAAYNAVHAVLSAHTAPGVVIVEPETPAAPLTGLFAAPVAAPEVAPVIMPAAQVTAQAGAGWEAADAYAAWRLAHGLTMAQWKVMKTDKAVLTNIRAAQVAPFCREAQKGDAQAAYAAFGFTAAPAQVSPAAVAPQPLVPAEVAPVMLPGIALAPMQVQAKAAKPQPSGTVALNGLKRYAKTHGLQIPARAADVEAGTFAAVRQHVETERAQGHTVTGETVALWLTAQVAAQA